MKKLVLASFGIAGLAVVGADQAPRINAAPARVDVAYVMPDPPSAPTKPAAQVDELNAALLSRSGKEVEIGELFAAPAPVAPSAPPPVAATSVKAPEPPTPMAPPLPFTYFGRMTKSGKVIVYLLRNQELLLAEAGATLDGTYRVETITAAAVQFTYLPLQTRQDLSITSAQ